MATQDTIATTRNNVSASLTIAPGLRAEVDQLRQSYQRQTFWKYHITKVAPFEYYLTTNPDLKHRVLRNGPSYFAKLETQNNSFKLILKQQTPASSLVVVEKIKGDYKVSYEFSEHKRGAVIVNSDGAQRSKLSLRFQQQQQQQHPQSSLNESVHLQNDYTCGEKLHVCELKDVKKGMLFKNKINGVKLGKQGSLYFLDTSNLPDNFSWYDPVVAFFRPCNRSTTNKLTKNVLKTSRLSLTGSSSSGSRKLFGTSKVDFSSLSMGNGSDSDDDNENYEDDDDDDDLDCDDTDSNKLQNYYISHDGLYSRHPLDDSPNDYKLGWLTIYEKANYFDINSKGCHWQAVMAMTLARAFEANLSKLG